MLSFTNKIASPSMKLPHKEILKLATESKWGEMNKGGKKSNIDYYYQNIDVNYQFIDNKIDRKQNIDSWNNKINYQQCLDELQFYWCHYLINSYLGRSLKVEGNATKYGSNKHYSLKNFISYPIRNCFIT